MIENWPAVRDGFCNWFVRDSESQPRSAYRLV